MKNFENMVAPLKSICPDAFEKPASQIWLIDH